MAMKRIVFTIVGQVLVQLFMAEARRLQRTIDDIVRRNEGDNWFLYQGKVYTSSVATTSPSNKGFPQLQLSLLREMDEYIRDQKELESDQHQIKQILMTRLQSCETYQQIRDNLPDCIVSLVPELSALPALFEQGYLAPTHDRFVAQYAKVLPKIEFYCGTRLIY